MIRPSSTICDAKALLELESNSSLNRALTTLIKTSFLEQRPLNWKPVKCELVVNTKLTEDFIRIKSEFQRSAEQPCESEENYAFLIETDAQVNNICQNGYSCQETAYNVLGQSKSGIYLCKYSDISLKYAEAKKWPDNLTLKMIVFKICYGKQTLAMVRKASKLPSIPPTNGFHSHSSVIPPKELEDIETQFDHSQIFLYELNSDKIATKRPRHCLPYAVITWLKFNDGTEWPHNFSEVEGDIAILDTDSIQVAMETDDTYMKNKLKDILKLSEEAAQKQAANEAAAIQAMQNNIEQTPINTNGSTSPPAVINGNNNNETENATSINNNSNTNSLNGSMTNAETSVENQQTTSESATTNGDLQNPNSQTSESKSPLNGVPNSSTTLPAAISPSATATTNATTTTASSTTPTMTSTYQAKPYSHYQKPMNTYAYRQAAAASISPYLLAQSPSPYGIRMQYLAQAQAQAAAQPQFFTAGSPYANLQPAMQQQVFLCRGPNGYTYVTAPQAAHLLGTQQAAYMQPSAAAGAASYTGAPAAYKLPVAYQQLQQAAPQPQQQIIYQAAPQPAQPQANANGNKSGIISGANSIVVAGNAVQAAQQQALQAAANQQQAQQQAALQAAAASQQQQVQAVTQTQVSVHAPPTQSPKNGSAGQPTGNAQYAAAQYQTQNGTPVYASQSQINQLQQQLNAAAYPGQQYVTYAPTASNNIGQAAYYANPSSYVLAQGGAGQQFSAPNQSIYGYAAAQIPGAIAANGFASGPQQGQISMALPAGAQTPAGYQIVDYRALSGIPGAAGAVQIDQFGQAVPRPRLINVRHHPYQRN